MERVIVGSKVSSPFFVLSQLQKLRWGAILKWTKGNRPERRFHKAQKCSSCGWLTCGHSTNLWGELESGGVVSNHSNWFFKENQSSLGYCNGCNRMSSREGREGIAGCDHSEPLSQNLHPLNKNNQKKRFVFWRFAPSSFCSDLVFVAVSLALFILFKWQSFQAINNSKWSKPNNLWYLLWTRNLRRNQHQQPEILAFDDFELLRWPQSLECRILIRTKASCNSIHSGCCFVEIVRLGCWCECVFVFFSPFVCPSVSCGMVCELWEIDFWLWSQKRKGIKALNSWPSANQFCPFLHFHKQNRSSKSNEPKTFLLLRCLQQLTQKRFSLFLLFVLALLTAATTSCLNSHRWLRSRGVNLFLSHCCESNLLLECRISPWEFDVSQEKGVVGIQAKEEVLSSFLSKPWPTSRLIAKEPNAKNSASPERPPCDLLFVELRTMEAIGFVEEQFEVTVFVLRALMRIVCGVEEKSRDVRVLWLLLLEWFGESKVTVPTDKFASGRIPSWQIPSTQTDKPRPSHHRPMLQNLPKSALWWCCECSLTYFGGKFKFGDGSYHTLPVDLVRNNTPVIFRITCVPALSFPSILCDSNTKKRQGERRRWSPTKKWNHS